MREIFRKTSHMLFGLLITAFILLSPHDFAVQVMTAVVFVSVAIADAISKGYNIPLFSIIVNKMERDVKVPGKGAIIFFISALLCTVIFSKDYAAIAILVLSVTDGISTIVGTKFGKHRLYGKKSWEGTAAGLIAGFIVLLPFTTIFIAVIAAIAGSVTELLSPIDDNLTVPFVVCIAVYSLQFF
ncbi:diacylglycerol/polyprenol kinase family protein [Methanoplanus endosymbiosus]|uniref:SEC59/DGK1/VTE5 family protein n=1 Tax=Methanoplanus endosymbiosus TaxID=33865 RepID=A0A9E7TJK4_9EURY|nr:diacylglycerol/polyprenol kinase family protein [Methanoplanus endosymbiosus]UUX91919.1 SEC59/DGK1/VTE5 family protein [Methanoplanus endosymbiosus]